MSSRLRVGLANLLSGKLYRGAFVLSKLLSDSSALLGTKEGSELRTACLVLDTRGKLLFLFHALKDRGFYGDMRLYFFQERRKIREGASEYYRFLKQTGTFIRKTRKRHRRGKERQERFLE